jgi:hypothetical protein
MEKLILLDFIWADLHSEHIIWYALIQSFFSVALDLCLFIINGIIHICSFYGPIVVKFLWWANYCMFEL